PIGQNCAGTIELTSTADVRILRDTFEWNKAYALQFDKVNGVLVRASTFTGSYDGGVWMNHNSDTPSSDVHFENNVFRNIHGGAITFSAHGKAVLGPDISYLPSTITGNIIQHDHWDLVDSSVGGQLVIEQYTSDLLVQNNQIFDGRNEADPTHFAQGVEI